MGNCSRLGLILIVFLCALTGYGQNQRVTSLTATTGITNAGTFRLTSGTPGAGKVLTDLTGTGVGTWQIVSATDTNALQRLNGLGTNTTLNGLTLNGGGLTNPFTLLQSGVATFSGGSTFAAGSTNTSHQRNTGWVENSGNVTNTSAGTVKFQGGTLLSAGSTNTAHQRNTGWVENSAGVTNTSAGQVVNQGGTTHAAGVTNSAGGVRTTTWAENTAGVTNRSATATRQDAPLLINGGFSLVPTLIAAVGSVNQGTNAYQWWTTNADFTVLFGGTPVEGSRGQFDIKNTAATNITVTWPSSWSVAQQALITTFTASSNGITEVFWYYEGGSNRVRVATKEIIENFLNPTAGQAVVFHDENTKTNKTIAGSGDVTAASNFGTDNVALRADGTGKGAQGSGITIDDSNNLGTPGGLRGQTANITNTLNVAGATTLTSSSNSTTALVSGNAGYGGTVTVAGAVTNLSTYGAGGAASFGSTVRAAGAASLLAALTVAGTASVDTGLVTNNITYLSVNLDPITSSTNFTVDFSFGARHYVMTNAVWFNQVAQVPAANQWKGWGGIFINNSGGALRIGMDPLFKRSGTNNASVPNGARAKVLFESDLTGGTQLTNFLGQIILFDNP